MIASQTVIHPAARASRSLSSQKVRHLRVASLKYSQNEGTTASMTIAKNDRATENTTALVQVHSHSRKKRFPRSIMGARRRIRPSGRGRLMADGPGGSRCDRVYRRRARGAPGGPAGPG